MIYLNYLKLFSGKDHVIRTVQLRSGKLHVERAMQDLHPLELSCCVIKKKQIINEMKEAVPARALHKKLLMKHSYEFEGKPELKIISQE